MNKRSTIAAISDFIGVCGSAIAVSRALESNRQPMARDLRALGIDPKQFGSIGR